MQILGRGRMAGAFAAVPHPPADALVFATGTSDSSHAPDAELAREAAGLDEAIAACRSGGLRLVFLSSAGLVYGNYSGGVREEDTPRPASRYGRHKLALEDRLRGSGARFLILRVSNAVGPGQRTEALVPALCAQIQRGSVEVRTGAHRDLIDCRDVAHIAVALLQAGVEREVFNVASGVPVRVEDLVGYLEQRLGQRARHIEVPRPDAYRVCIDKLRARLPPASLPFDPGYPWRVVDGYVASLPSRGRELSAPA